MNRFTSMIVTAAFLFAAGSANAQNLTGSWRTSNNVDGRVVHNGNQIQSTEWIAKTVGTSRLTGSHKVYTGTWRNQAPDWIGSGTVKITIINANKFIRSWEGTAVYRGVRYPVRGTETWYRNGVRQ